VDIEKDKNIMNKLGKLEKHLNEMKELIKKLPAIMPAEIATKNAALATGLKACNLISEMKNDTNYHLLHMQCACIAAHYNDASFGMSWIKKYLEEINEVPDLAITSDADEYFLLKRDR
jgi:hypothetical protein